MTTNRTPRRLSNGQVTSIVVLWLFLLYIIFTTRKSIDGPLIVTVMISGALVLIPIVRELKRRQEDGKK